MYPRIEVWKCQHRMFSVCLWVIKNGGPKSCSKNFVALHFYQYSMLNFLSTRYFGSSLRPLLLSQVAAINTAMAALTKTVGVFPKERAIVDRERAKGSYALGPYLLSKLIAEIPVGAAFPLMFGAVLYPMASLHPTLSRFVSLVPFWFLALDFCSRISLSFSYIMEVRTSMKCKKM